LEKHQRAFGTAGGKRNRKKEKKVGEKKKVKGNRVSGKRGKHLDRRQNRLGGEKKRPGGGSKST